MTTALLTPPEARDDGVSARPAGWGLHEPTPEVVVAGASPARRRVLPLPFRAGERMDQPTFHALAESLPAGVRAELIEGVVIVPPSVTDDHATVHIGAAVSAGTYNMRTPGVLASDNGSVVLGPESEPQPDVALRLAPECGGQSRVENRYVTGAPELVIEIAVSTESTDLHARKRDYERGGVREYVVVAVERRRVVWFEHVDGHFVERDPDADGVYRSRQFPGFWLDPEALLNQDGPRLLEVIHQGLASPEHAAFVEELAARRRAATMREEV